MTPPFPMLSAYRTGSRYICPDAAAPGADDDVVVDRQMFEVPR